ncbi:unnamed protein product [Rodentolepis nana]|uniref:Uncharacterized protein n=1 Tax=Rodentolepis nana TaxID=102285 RepID=A0A3P7T3E7_RODNA|nr:unnamed protein product [Rodentolepis nana]
MSAALLPIQEVVHHWLKDEVTYLTCCNRCIRSDCLPTHGRPEYRSGIPQRFSQQLPNRDSYITVADESVEFSDDGILSQRCPSRPKKNGTNYPPRNHGELTALSSNRIDTTISLDQTQFLFPGKDYVNLIYKELYEVDKPETCRFKQISLMIVRKMEQEYHGGV